MALLEWNDNFSTKIKKIDEQHKQLIDIINELDYGIKNNKGDNVIIIMESLISYTKYHFSEEEKLMERYSYPDIDKHKEAHRFFREKIEESKKSTISNLASAFQIMKFLSEWLTNHILKVDKEYAEYILKS